MRITARGWRRVSKSGRTTICDYDVREAAARDEASLYQPDVLYLTRTYGVVDLTVGPAALTLGGKYLINVQLTDEEIVRLFLELYPELRTVLERVVTAERQQ